MSDPIIDQILAKGLSAGVRISPDFERILSLSVREISEFERLLSQPAKFSEKGSFLPKGALDDLPGRSELLARKAGVRAVLSGLKTFAKTVFPGVVIEALFWLFVDTIAELWDFYNSRDLEPQKFDKGGCGEGLDILKGGIWREVHAEGVFSLLDGYEAEVVREFSVLSDKHAPALIKDFWRDMEGMYFQAAFSFGAVIRKDFPASAFGEQRKRQTRNGVRPR